jgi:putative aminopeptidase FrvX
MKELNVQELAKRLCEAFGVSGFEDEIRSVIRREVAPLVDEVKVDTLGNLIALRRGKGGGKRVMLAAHMDQIGLMVTYVDEKGYMPFTAIGGIPALSSWGGQVRFADGTVGTIGLDGRKDPAKDLPDLRDLYIDVGATERSQVKQKVGDVAAFWPGFVAQGNAWFSPNLDDRAGCVVLVQLLHELKGAAIAHDLHLVFTAQEEVGPRGAQTSGYAIDPEIAIAVDVTRTGDERHPAYAMEVYLGRGVAIKMQDSRMIGHPILNRLLIATAEATGIQVVRSGVPATALSLPCRHVHTPSEIVDQRDVEAAVRLLHAFLSQPIDLEQR